MSKEMHLAALYAEATSLIGKLDGINFVLHNHAVKEIDEQRLRIDRFITERQIMTIQVEIDRVKKL